MSPIEQSPGDIQRQKDDEEALNHPVVIDGHKLKLSDVFGDAYQARDFRTKLKLLNSKAGGEPDGMDAKMKSEDEIADELFDPKKREKNPTGMDGE